MSAFGSPGKDSGPIGGAGAICVGIRCDAISGILRVASQTATLCGRARRRLVVSRESGHRSLLDVLHPSGPFQIAGLSRYDAVP
jgi:hypothetical protein